MNKKITLTEGQLRNIVRQTLLEEGLFDFLKGGKDTSKLTEKDLAAVRLKVSSELDKLRTALKTALRSDKPKPLEVLGTVLKMLQLTISNAVLADAEKAMKGSSRPWIFDLDKQIVWAESAGGRTGTDDRLDPVKYYIAELSKGSMGSIGFADASQIAQLSKVEEALSAWMRGAIASPLRPGPLVKYSESLEKLTRDDKLAAEVMELVAPRRS